MVEQIKILVEQKTPFLIVKYSVSFIGIKNNCYDLVTMYGDKLQYSPMARKDVMQVLREFNIPVLCNMGSNGTVWGDSRFREKFKKGRYKV